MNRKKKLCGPARKYPNEAIQMLCSTGRTGLNISADGDGKTGDHVIDIFCYYMSYNETLKMETPVPCAEAKIKTAASCVKAMGFKDVFANEEEYSVLADVCVNYDLHNKKYTITGTTSSKALQNVLDLYPYVLKNNKYSYAERTYIDSKGQKHSKYISINVFKRAIADYLAQQKQK